MIRKKRYLAAKMGLLALGLMLLFPGQAEAADKKTIYNSPYVSFSPDGKAFTTCAGDQNYTWYAEDDSTTVYTDIKSSLRSLRTGEHYYKVARWGEVPVGSWKVVHRPGQCIHDGYTSDENWHGIQFGTQKCMQYYYSGWKAFCADCGEPLEDSNIYMSREAASSIQYLDLGSEKNPVFYYYLCPFCRNLEQGVGLSAHWCKKISWNQYRIFYDPNIKKYNGYMDYSYHMYNNETIYEGETVTPVTHLTENNYTRVGYVFTGWNTKQDGSGVSFTDKEEIYNLSSSDWNDQSTWTDTDRGTITLYAQWRKSESTLVIDANGGRYNGVDKYSLTEPYSSKYLLQKNLIVSPNGYTVAFETNGGTNVDTITGTMHFVEWMQIQPFNGFVTNDTYMFMAPDRNIDTLKAVYQSDPITLPVTTKDGWSFGGWYYDPDFSLPAGGAGDQIIPSKDMTLYAQWVDLRLQAVDNYEVNDGKGAVDLSWSQSDQNNKTYLVYQKKEDGAWIRVNSANDISSTTVIDQTYTFDGQAKQYTVPYTGLYSINAMGAQGQSYGSYTGGYGGSVTGTFWLRKGEILTYVVGGQNGYNGGGNASSFGNGGGMTSVVSNQKGTLLIAGGGGGAFSHGNGNAGGSAASVIDGNAGQAGMAGGGAGYQGGTAGERLVHHHTSACDTSRSIIGSFRNNNYSYEDDDDDRYYVKQRIANVSADGFKYLHFSGLINQQRGHRISAGSGTLKVYNQNGLIFQKSIYDIESFIRTEYQRAIAGNYGGENNYSSYSHANYDFDDNDQAVYEDTDYVWLHYNGDGSVTKWRKDGADDDYIPNPSANATSYFIPSATRGGSSWFYGINWYFKYDIPIPAGSTNIRIEFESEHETESYLSVSVQEAVLTGRIGCGMTEGQVISSKPAYGGSNYVNSSYALMYEMNSGERSGSGIGELHSKAIGYQESLDLAGVTATDFAAPDKISDQVTKEPLDGKSIRVTWQVPSDNGTDYYHKVESYLTGSTSMLCGSNVTKNTLVSGVMGYYYLVDQNGDTVVTGNANYVQDPHVNVVTAEYNQYLHIAAVDVAGNISETTVTADDDLSGVKDFYVVIKNTDNAIIKTYLPDVDGSIRITITEDEPIFSGDFTVLGYAVDNVGNENNLSYGTTEFALASSVERILSPHDPIFKCGESGILTFTTWGYADRVEVIFPESMTALDPTLNKVYDYTDCPGYMITEHLQFMVPLYTPENQNLEITVRAYKGDKKLEDHPTISVIGVSGTVLDEFRTRLR